MAKLESSGEDGLVRWSPKDVRDFVLPLAFNELFPRASALVGMMQRATERLRMAFSHPIS
jgi:hypothetical protein